MKHPRKDKQLARDVEILGTKMVVMKVLRRTNRRHYGENSS